MDECPEWWYQTNSKGLCEEQAWRRDTAIAVPVVVVIVAAAVVIAFVIVKKGCCKAKKSNGEPLRDKTVNEA